MKKPTRDAKVDTILKTISTQFPDNMREVLEAYISQLEANQKVEQTDTTLHWDSNNPPIWSHARQENRRQRRKERAIRNFNNYQGLKPLSDSSDCSNNTSG